MAKTPSNNGKPWTKADNAKLREEVRHNTPTHLIALHLGRTPGAIYNQASKEGISLDPPNPWHPRKR